MSHFAKVEDGIVTEVTVAEQEFIDTLNGTWVQTSYNTRGGKHYNPETHEEDSGTPLRKNYAGIGYTCLLYTSPSPRDRTRSRMPSSA